jgi:hypothetical protein
MDLEMVAAELESVVAAELFGQCHDGTWHAQHAVAHEVTASIGAENDLGRVRRRQCRPTGDRRQAPVRAPVAEGPVVEGNARLGRAAGGAETKVSH